MITPTGAVFSMGIPPVYGRETYNSGTKNPRKEI
jgi:hypothetical protein